MEFSKLYEYYIDIFSDQISDQPFESAVAEKELEEKYRYVYSFWKEIVGIKLDLSKEEDKKTLYEFLRDIFRYRMLNDLIFDLYNDITIDRQDKFMIENLSSINDIVRNIIKKYESCDYNEEKLPSLSHENLEEYFVGFLKMIDKSGDYLKVYNNLKASKKLIFFDELDEEEREKIRRSLDVLDEKSNNFSKKLHVIIDRKGNISDFRNLAHEFIHHYLEVIGVDPKMNYLFREFPSIFYENIAIRFLLMKGYFFVDISNLYNYRYKDITDKALQLTCLNDYLKIYNDNNFTITPEADVERVKERISEFIDNNGIEEYRKSAYQNKILNNPEQMAKDCCDIANVLLVDDPYYLVRNYPYLIGQLLSTHYVREIEKGNFNLKDMKKLVDNLSSMDPKIILEIYSRQKKYNR